MINRNKFLKLMGSLVGTVIIPDLGFASLLPHPSDQILFDLHCHPGLFVAKGYDQWQSLYPGDDAAIKTVNEMNNVVLTGAFFSLVADLPLLKVTGKGIIYERSYRKGEAWTEYKRQMSILKELMLSSEARFVTKASQLVSEGSSEKVAAFFACEGGDFIEGLGLLDEAYEDGLRSVQLVHYVPNHLGDLQTSENMHNGLSSMGKEVIKSMNKLGMVIDVAHASKKTVEDVVNLTDSPIILSHSILKTDSNRPIEGRAITKEHAKLVAESGGLVGAWPSGFNLSFDDFVDNTLRLVDVIGIDHVGLGTDMDANYKPVFDNYSQLPKWISALEKKGLSKTEVQKIAGTNAHRVLKQILKS